MRIELALLLVLLATTTAISQTSSGRVDLLISGIGTGSPYSEVLVQFGMPEKQSIEKSQACNGEAQTVMTMEYPGLRIEVLGDGNAQGFEVISMQLTSKKWQASRVKIGDSQGMVEKRFGKPNSTRIKNGITTYDYQTPGNTGNVRFEFTEGKLSLIAVVESLC
jgi:hypothetical protein